MVKIPELIQKPNLGDYIELFKFDLTLYGEGFRYMRPGDEGATVQAVTWDGDVYSPWALSSDGWEISAGGPMPRPTITLGNTSSILTPLFVNNNDLVGCTVQRIRTYARYLDDGADPDPTATYPIEEYLVNQRLSLDDEAISIELASHLDQDMTMLPGRQVMREYCPFVTRTYNATTQQFDYTGAICPFNETEGIDGLPRDADGNITTPENEVFSKKLGTCCKARYGNGELPFGGFPGVSRIRAR